jgi:hypothetical protein
MKLKVPYKLDTWARDDRYNSHNSFTQIIDSNEVEFMFDDTHNLVGINVFLPNAEIVRDETGAIVSFLGEERETQIHSIVNYISNFLWQQTGKCEFSKTDSPAYVPETEDDRVRLQGLRFITTRDMGISVNIRGRVDLSPTAMTRYINQKDELAMYVDAHKMNNPTGKYREFFRILEHYFPYEGREFDEKTSAYLSRFDVNWTTDFIRQLRLLRNRCSHARRIRGYITSNDLRGMKEVGSKIDTIQRIAKTLLDNPRV